MNILHLHTGLNITCGISKTIYLLTKYLNSGFTHFVIAENGDAKLKFIESGINVRILNLRRNNIVNTVKIYKNLKNFVKKNNIEIIHSHHRYFDLISDIIKKTYPVKTVTSVQSKVTGRKYLSYKADKLVAVSITIKNHLVNYFGINPLKIILINNFVDLSEIRNLKNPESIREKLFLDKKMYLFGYIGRISIDEKGIDILLNAYKKFNEKYKNTCLIIIGRGEDEKFVKDFIEKEKIPAFLIPQKENIFDYYDMLDTIIIPSKVDPFPLVALESGLMKKPVIASDVDGLSEIIVNNENGLLFEKNNINELVESMEKYYLNIEMRNNYAGKLNNLIINNFTSEIMVEKYKKLYMNLFI